MVINMDCSIELRIIKFTDDTLTQYESHIKGETVVDYEVSHRTIENPPEIVINVISFDNIIVLARKGLFYYNAVGKLKKLYIIDRNFVWDLKNPFYFMETYTKNGMVHTRNISYLKPNESFVFSQSHFTFIVLNNKKVLMTTTRQIILDDFEHPRRRGEKVIIDHLLEYPDPSTF